MEDNILHPNCMPPPPSPPLALAVTVKKDSENNGIQVRDYAYPSSISPSSNPTRRLSPVPEIFDQYEGLAEVEYRWMQSPQMLPVPGKTLSRLLDLGWITQQEVLDRASPMDLEELRKHLGRLPMYPWKPISWTMVPNIEERKELMLEKAPYFQQRDIKAMVQLKKIQKKDAKRRAEEGGDSGEAHNGSNKLKKRRNFPLQGKQYPAPLHAYDPNIYPEVIFPTVLTVSPASEPSDRRSLMRQSTWIVSETLQD